jgi:signal recognition particle subunit SEC65|tara:strand:- start:166 stop:549 length:384 start_codon:yes stop_codon:yes gene_type:complete
MPNNPKNEIRRPSGRFVSKHVTVPMNPTKEELEVVSKELGIEPKDIVKIVTYGNDIRAAAVENDLSPGQMMSALLNLVIELVGCFEGTRGESSVRICEDIHQQILEGVRLAHGQDDAAFDDTPMVTH